MHKYLTEFIGALFLSIVFCLTIHSGVGTLAALGIGGILIGMVQAGSRISGAHYNPAVSLGAWVSGKMTGGDFFYYASFQMMGVVIGTSVGHFLLKTENILLADSLKIDILATGISEFLGTFAWTYAWLGAAAIPSAIQKGHQGWAIGFAYIGSFLAFNRISGGAFHPGLALALAVDGTIMFKDIWVHLSAEFLGALAAASVAIAMDRALEDSEK